MFKKIKQKITNKKENKNEEDSNMDKRYKSFDDSENEDVIETEDCESEKKENEVSDDSNEKILDNTSEKTDECDFSSNEKETTNTSEEQSSEQCGNDARKMSEEIKNLRTYFEAEFEFLKNQLTIKDDLVSKLFEEINHYKSLVSKHKSIVRELIQCRETFINDYRHIERDQESFFDKEKILNSYNNLIEDLKLKLEHLECEVISNRNSVEMQLKKFNPSNQEIRKVVPTDNEELNGVVKEILSDLYIFDGQKIYPEKVIVYKKANI